jgi:hypothetical protein
MATIFPNYLQRTAAEIAKATPTKRLTLAMDYYNTINNLPTYESAKAATEAVDAGKFTNGALYRDNSLKGALAIAKGSGKKVIIKNPVKTL